MFGSFRRHQKWIWILGVLVIIPSFVIFFSPNATLRATEGQVAIVNGKPPTINGKTIPRDEFNAAKIEAVRGHFFRSNGKWPENDEASKEGLDRDAIVRVFMLQKLKDLDIHISEEAAARLALERLGTYPPSSLEKRHLLPHGLSM